MTFFLAGEITQVKESIPWVRCDSGNVSVDVFPKSVHTIQKQVEAVVAEEEEERECPARYFSN